jgi:hypothetical protein
LRFFSEAGESEGPNDGTHEFDLDLLPPVLCLIADGQGGNDLASLLPQAVNQQVRAASFARAVDTVRDGVPVGGGGGLDLGDDFGVRVVEAGSSAEGEQEGVVGGGGSTGGRKRLSGKERGGGVSLMGREMEKRAGRSGRRTCRP